ncbi:uncharacterized protein V6R79_013576 [Siganus canaliculatus]
MIHRLLGALLLMDLSVSLQAASSAPAPLPPPTKVRFDAVDYRNVLCWTPPTNSTTLQYYVQWKIYGEPQWLDVDGCQGINQPQCDLSNLTSDPSEWYYARVHASSQPSSKSAWALSPRFNPQWDTVISPPVLKLNVTERGIVVRVKPAKTLVRKMHSSLHYKIYVKPTSGEEEVHEISCCHKKLTLKGLNHKAQYCLQAQTMIPREAMRSSRSSAKCVSTL